MTQKMKHYEEIIEGKNERIERLETLVKKLQARCVHKFGKTIPTPYVGIYMERCLHCDHINEFEKDFT